MDSVPRHKIPDVMLNKINKLLELKGASCKVVKDIKTDDHWRHELMAWHHGITFIIVRNYKKYSPRAHYIQAATMDGELVFEYKAVGDDLFLKNLTFGLDRAEGWNKRTKIEI